MDATRSEWNLCNLWVRLTLKRGVPRHFIVHARYRPLNLSSFTWIYSPLGIRKCSGLPCEKQALCLPRISQKPITCGAAKARIMQRIFHSQVNQKYPFQTIGLLGNPCAWHLTNRAMHGWCSTLSSSNRHIHMKTTLEQNMHNSFSDPITFFITGSFVVIFSFSTIYLKTCKTKLKNHW